MLTRKKQPDKCEISKCCHSFLHERIMIDLLNQFIHQGDYRKKPKSDPFLIKITSRKRRKKEEKTNLNQIKPKSYRYPCCCENINQPFLQTHEGQKQGKIRLSTLDRLKVFRLAHQDHLLSIFNCSDVRMSIFCSCIIDAPSSLYFVLLYPVEMEYTYTMVFFRVKLIWSLGNVSLASPLLTCSCSYTMKEFSRCSCSLICNACEEKGYR